MRTHIEYICNYLNFPAQAVACFVDAWDKITADEAAAKVWTKWITAYEQDIKTDLKTGMQEVGEAAEKVGIHKYTSDELYYLCLTRGLKKYYDEKGLPEQIYRDTASDLRWKLDECWKMYGIWGSFVAFWFPEWFWMTRFALGRLQFELWEFPEKYEQNGRKNTNGFNQVINTHIPSCGPLTRENAEDSFRQAAEFFKDTFPGEEVPIYCESWLLFEPHREFIAPDSGIAGFMDWFDIFHTVYEGHDMWRVFYRMDAEENPADLPEDTVLRRGYKQRLLEGKGTGWGEGIFYFNRKENVFHK